MDVTQDLTTRITYGTHTDGTPAQWTLRNNHGGCHGLVLGGIGTGKTTTLGTLARAALEAGHTVWCVSSPWEQIHAPGSTSLTADALLKELRSCTASWKRPLAVFIDDADHVFTPNTRKSWEGLVGNAAPGHISITAALPTFTARGLGDSLELARNFLQDNILSFATGLSTTGLRDLDAKVNGLPPLAGVGHHAFHYKLTNPTPVTVNA